MILSLVRLSLLLLKYKQQNIYQTQDALFLFGKSNELESE